MTELPLVKMVMENFGNVGALLIAGALVFHLIMTMRNKGRIDNVQAALYEQLRQELTDARGELAALNASVLTLVSEKSALREQFASLTTKVAHLEECEETVHLLKERLQEKDDTIREQQIENSVLKDEISKLKDRIHHLELRLAQDEARFPKEG